jgi:hypothetical protein
MGEISDCFATSLCRLIVVPIVGKVEARSRSIPQGRSVRYGHHKGGALIYSPHSGAVPSTSCANNLRVARVVKENSVRIVLEFGAWTGIFCGSSRMTGLVGYTMVYV